MSSLLQVPATRRKTVSKGTWPSSGLASATVFPCDLEPVLPLSCPPGCIPVSLSEKDRQRGPAQPCVQEGGRPCRLAPAGQPDYPTGLCPQPGASPGGGQPGLFPSSPGVEHLSQADHVSLGNVRPLLKPLSCLHLIWEGSGRKMRKLLSVFSLHPEKTIKPRGGCFCFEPRVQGLLPIISAPTFPLGFGCPPPQGRRAQAEVD